MGKNGHKGPHFGQDLTGRTHRNRPFRLFRGLRLTPELKMFVEGKNWAKSRFR